MSVATDALAKAVTDLQAEETEVKNALAGLVQKVADLQKAVDEAANVDAAVQAAADAVEQSVTDLHNAVTPA